MWAKTCKKQVAVSSSEVVPVPSAHAEESWFTEPRYSSERVWNQLGNLRQEEVAHRSLCSNSRVRISGVQASLGFLAQFAESLELVEHVWQQPGRGLVQLIGQAWQPCGHETVLCSAADLREDLETAATSHSARTVAQKAGQSSTQKKSSRASGCAQLLSEALTAGEGPGGRTAEHKNLSCWFGCQ